MKQKNHLMTQAPTEINVILYTRVSTDEQAENCSLDMQEHRLRMYCANHGYNVIAVYHEDFSARGHDLKRPEMLKIYDFCKKHRREVNKILFLRWDRYARNVEFAFAYKRKFYDELGIEINSIEAPINFNSPDWSTMMSIYCGVAHTEDDKISKRTKDGIHGHLLNGEWCGKAPRGYKNVRRSRSECWIEVNEPEAALIRNVFAEVAKGLEKPNNIRRRLCPHIGHSPFFVMLRNKFYIGIIKVPAYEGDVEQEVRGKHVPIIDEETFYDVQDILDGKKMKGPKVSKVLNPDLYLRRVLVCPICGHTITGAVSRGHGGLYTYYYCNFDHKHIKAKASVVNDGFSDYIGAIIPDKAVLTLYKEIFQDLCSERGKVHMKEAEKLQNEVDKLNHRIHRINDLFFDGEISKEDKDENIARYKRDIAKLEDQIEVLQLNEDQTIREKLQYSADLLGELPGFFQQIEPDIKIKLIGSIFPEKIKFDGEKYRTSRVNEVVDHIIQNTSTLQDKTEVEPPALSGDSTSVAPRGIEPLFKV